MAQDGYSFQFSPRRSPSVDIVRAVAWVKNEEDAALEPLSYSVDPDALDAIVGHWSNEGDPGRSTGRDPTRAEIRFEYEGCVVTIGGPDGFTVEAGAATDR